MEDRVLHRDVLGKTLVPILERLCRWSEEHNGEVEAARARAAQVDGRAAEGPPSRTLSAQPERRRRATAR